MAASTPVRLAPWLESETVTQLLLGNGWLQEQYKNKLDHVKPDPLRKWDGVYHDNGSCLDIIADHDTRLLRIFQLSPPILTDGETYITAYFAPDTHRGLSTHHVGLILAVHKFTLLYTPYGPPRDRLRFILNSFDCLHTSREPLGEPRPLLQSEDIASVLGQLYDTRTEEDRRCLRLYSNQQEDGEMSPPGRHAPHTGASTSSPSTQLPYGTQFVPNAWNRTSHNAVPSPLSNKAVNVQETKESGDKQARLLTLLRLNQPNQSLHSVSESPSLTTHPEVPSAGGFRKPSSKVVNTPPGNRQVNAIQNSDGFHRAKNTPSKAPICLLETEASSEDDTAVPNCNDDMDDTEVITQHHWTKELVLTRKALVVPLDQRAILDKPESWQKPQAGYHFPSGGNMPIETLVHLISLTDAQADAEADAQADAEPISNSKLETNVDSTADEDSEEESAHEPEEDAVDKNGAQIHEPLESSQLSWSQSPTPEPPKRLAQLENDLPPDSSPALPMDNDSSLNVQNEAPAKSHKSPIRIDSSCEIVAAMPPSSPPFMRRTQNSDEEIEMETAVPRGLGQDAIDSSSTSYVKLQTFTSKAPHSQPVVQVQETLYAKIKSNDAMGKFKLPSTQNQCSSSASKNTSSASIVYASYEPKSVSRKHASPKQAVSVVDLHGNHDPNSVDKHHSPEKESSHVEDLAKLDHEEPSDVLMDDVLLGAENLASSPPPAEGNHSPVQEIGSAKSNSSSVPRTSFTKRKHERSPSNKRRTKRREIKIVGFEQDSPSTVDPALNVRRQREESLQQFREERRSNQNATKPPTPMRIPQTKPPVEQEDMQTKTMAPPETTHDAAQSTEHLTIFQKFKAAYPEYNGDIRHFKGQCTKIYELDMADTMVSEWMWDDFIVRNRTEYTKYAMDCMDRGEDAWPYLLFYKKKLRSVIYEKDIITSRETLVQALEEISAPPKSPETSKQTSVSSRRSLPFSPAKPQDLVAPSEPPQTSTPTSRTTRQSLPSISLVRDFAEPSKPSETSRLAMASSRCPLPSANLVQDFAEPSKPFKTSRPATGSSRRSLPWARDAALPRTKSSTHDRPRHSLPARSHKDMSTATPIQATPKSSSRAVSTGKARTVATFSTESDDIFLNFARQNNKG